MAKTKLQKAYEEQLRRIMKQANVLLDQGYVERKASKGRFGTIQGFSFPNVSKRPTWKDVERLKKEYSAQRIKAGFINPLTGKSAYYEQLNKSKSKTLTPEIKYRIYCDNMLTKFEELASRPITASNPPAWQKRKDKDFKKLIDAFKEAMNREGFVAVGMRLETVWEDVSETLEAYANTGYHPIEVILALKHISSILLNRPLSVSEMRAFSDELDGSSGVMPTPPNKIFGNRFYPEDYEMG